MNLNEDSSGTNTPCFICKSCKQLGVETRSNDADSLQVDYDTISNESKCRSWLEKCSLISDEESISSSEISGSTDSQTKDDESECIVLTSDDSGINICSANDLIPLKAKQYENVQLTKCKDVTVGNITNFYGPVYINQTSSVVNQKNITNQVFVEKIAAVPKALFILDRRSWLAQPALEEKQYLEKPAQYVIIAHTATEEGLTQSENIYLVRTIQNFHIESRGWSDVGYNFLIGSDGNVYEGRGWGAIGAHTYGYNNISLCIAFVGYFKYKLPPEPSLNQAKALIKLGVETGAIDKDYRLVGHCQCRPFESPGRRLYDEIKTWDNWYDLRN